MAGEILFLGRYAMGEKKIKGTIRENLEVFYDNRLIWTDNFFVEDMVKIVKHPAGLDGANALATIIYISENASEYINDARKIINQFRNIRIGITVINNILLCKFLSPDQYILRKIYGEIWAKFRKVFGNYNAQLPRLWYV